MFCFSYGSSHTNTCLIRPVDCSRVVIIFQRRRHLWFSWSVQDKSATSFDTVLCAHSPTPAWIMVVYFTVCDPLLVLYCFPKWMWVCMYIYTIKCFKQFHHSIPYYAINLIQQPGSNKNKGKKKANDKTHFSHLRFSSLCPFVCWTPPTEVYFPSNHLCSWWFVVKIIINRLVLVLMIY